MSFNREKWQRMKDLRVVIFIILLILFNCNNHLDKEKIQDFGVSDQQFSFEFYNAKQERVKELFKDSLYVVAIKYHCVFDSISTDVESINLPIRTLFFHKIKQPLSEQDLVDKSVNYIRSNFELDSIYARNNKGFIFETVFNKRGVNYINGIIEDKVYLKTEESLKSDEIRLISKENLISKTVIVR
ncbi:hypothetical protein LRR18_02010 [Mangrovimonas sp. AS39]|uniref:hypothetical protein n=1 Tax=Mangrovimonas TaxID=1211036 RepID=UPI00197F708C|nr:MULTISPECIES: hypothetical protein [Mangrovimonas]MCF1190343.1 hypothetical protein [Mangrovimonas futianensis]MCF1193904.1 hypothetical protein [Mangrovimonas futianensis]NIK90891.1 hypothetical protein [Mangrovimonas sp. CR14]